MLKDEYSMAKLKPQNFNRTQRNIINIVFKNAQEETKLNLNQIF